MKVQCIGKRGPVVAMLSGDNEDRIRIRIKEGREVFNTVLIKPNENTVLQNPM